MATKWSEGWGGGHMANEIGEIWDLPTDRIHLFMFSIQTSRKSDLILTNEL